MIETYIKVSRRIQTKLLEKHQVTLREVHECFLNRTKGLLEDIRVAHKTEPPTLWFIPDFLQNANFSLLLFSPMLRSKIRNRAGYSSSLNAAWTKKSSCLKTRILKKLGYIAETDHCRPLKVVFMALPDGYFKVKTAYEPNEVERKLYEKYA